MAEMIDKVFSTQLAGQMTGFYGKQKMLRKLNNKLEMNNQQQKVVEMDKLIDSYHDRVELSEEGLYDDCEEGVDCPIMADEHVLSRMEEVLADAYEAQDEQGNYDPWTGTRDFLEFGEARDESYLDGYENDYLRDQLEDDLAYKEKELALAKRTAEREKIKRRQAEEQLSGANTTQKRLQPQHQQQQPHVKSPIPQQRPEQAERQQHQQQYQNQRLTPSSQHDHRMPLAETMPAHHAIQQESFDDYGYDFGGEQSTPHHYRQPLQQQHHDHQVHQEAPSYSQLQVNMWRQEQEARQDELRAAMEAEAIATKHAEEWERKKHDQQVQRALQQAEIDRQMRQEQQLKYSQSQQHQYQHTPEHESYPSQYGSSPVSGGKLQRYQEHLRQQDWSNLLAERELRQTQDQNLFTRKSEQQKVPSFQQQHQPQQQQHTRQMQNVMMPNPIAPLYHSQPTAMPSHSHMTGDDYAHHWTDHPFSSNPVQQSIKKSHGKKTGALRWLNPEWSIVGWVKNLINDEDEDADSHYHDHIGHSAANSMTQSPMEMDVLPMQDVLPSNIDIEKQPAHAIIISSIFSCLVTLFGLYLCLKVMLPKHRFERNSNLTVFYLMAFSYLIISVIPVSNSDSEVVYNFHKKWDHHPHTIVGVCTEIFRLAVILFHMSSITNLFLLTINRKFRDNEAVSRWAIFLREFNVVGSFVCLAFLIPLRADFDWMLSLPLPYLVAAIFIFAMQPDSKLELVLNLVILILIYCQLTQIFILAVFILNFKVFTFGYRKTKYIKTSSDRSIALGKSEFQDATSYLNATLECTTDGDALVTELAIKRDIRSYGIISIKEEKVEYVGSSGDASFILFDASQETMSSPINKKDSSGMSHLPVIEKSELQGDARIGNLRPQSDILSDKTDQPRRADHRSRSKSPGRGSDQSRKNIFNSTQTPVNGAIGQNHTFSSHQSSQVTRQNHQPGHSQPVSRAQYVEEPRQEYQAPQLLNTAHRQQDRHRQNYHKRGSETHMLNQETRRFNNQIQDSNDERPQNHYSHQRQHQPAPGLTANAVEQMRSPVFLDETRYHSTRENLKSQPADDHTDEEDLFLDCVGGRSTTNLANISNNTSGILFQMPTSPSQGATPNQGFQTSQQPGHEGLNQMHGQYQPYAQDRNGFTQQHR